LEPLISKAIAESQEAEILAKDVTPFLLKRIYELTDGQSLAANISLVRNNARLAAKLASHFATN
jgi:pseudouridine-5'-phosphate glycosidase